jgi:hypothetical protein
MTQDERIDLLVEYLRGLSATLSDDLLEDAASLIEELSGALYEECQRETVSEEVPPSPLRDTVNAGSVSEIPRSPLNSNCTPRQLGQPRREFPPEPDR